MEFLLAKRWRHKKWRPMLADVDHVTGYIPVYTWLYPDRFWLTFATISWPIGLKYGHNAWIGHR
jgi:hypothetical protein